jgi:D-glycero-D-manno-heptose 1,7-bisphosphate phosphatase
VSAAPRRATFLDRDGVLNRATVRDGKPYPPASLGTLEILPDVPDALHALKAAGFLLIGATNQPDVARGTQRRDVVEAINAKLCATLPLDDLLVCYHDDRDDCECRKPHPGLLLEAAAKHGIDLAASYMVGDRWRDVGAGRGAGCATIWIDRGYTEPWPEGCASDHTVASLAEAAAWIIAHAQRRQHTR